MGVAIAVIIILLIAIHVLEMGAYKLRLQKTLTRLLLQEVVTEDELFIILFCYHEIRSRRIRPFHKLSLSNEGFLINSKGSLASYSIIHRFIKQWYGTTEEENLKKFWIKIKQECYVKSNESGTNSLPLQDSSGQAAGSRTFPALAEQ